MIWVWVPGLLWALLSAIGLGMLFSPRCILCVNFGSRAMKQRVLALAKEEGTDSPRVQNILVGLDVYLFGFVLAGMNFCMDILRMSTNSWMPLCISDTACRAAAVDAADGSPSSPVCCESFLSPKICDETSVGVVSVFMLFTTLAPLPILLWWMNKQLNASAGREGEAYLQAPSGDAVDP